MAGTSIANAIDCFRNTRQEDNRLQTKPQFPAHSQQFQKQQQLQLQQHLQKQKNNEGYCATISKRLCVTYNNDSSSNNSNNSSNNNDGNNGNNIDNNNNNNNISLVVSKCHKVYTYQRQRPLSLCSLITISALVGLLHIPQNSGANATENFIFKSSQFTSDTNQTTTSASAITFSMQLIYSKPTQPPSSTPTQQQYQQQHQQQQKENHHQQSEDFTEQNKLLRTQRKRYGNHFHFADNHHDISLTAEWQNPCGGAFDSRNQHLNFNGHNPNPPARHYLRQLRQTIGFEYRVLNSTLNEIDINDMASWRLHHHRYRFLPTLKNKSKIALKRWYRNMQIFVAAFAYLGRIQYRWDSSKLLHTGRISHELNELLISARRLLCEIETAINGSYLQNRQQKLIIMTREEMFRRLKFFTTHHTEQEIPYEVSMIDIKFAKATYYDCLLSMWKILRRQMKQRLQMVKVNELYQRLMYHSIDTSIADDSIGMNLNSMLNSESSLVAGNSESQSESLSVENML